MSHGNGSAVFKIEENDEGEYKEEEGSAPGRPTLRRSLLLVDAAAVIVGVMIGSGIFASPGVVLQNSPNTVVYLMVWILAGIFALLGGLCYAELGAAIPESGGEYEYFRRAFHGVLGKENIRFSSRLLIILQAFLVVWSMWLVLKSGSQAIMSIVFARYLGSVIFGFDIHDKDIDQNWKLKSLAAGAIIFLTIINILGVRWGAILQRGITAMKMLTIALVLLMALYWVSFESLHPLKDNFSDPLANMTLHNIISAGGTAMMSALWAYDGFSQANALTEEVINPGRNMPLAITIGTLSVTAAYILVNLSYLCVLPAAVIISSRALAIDMSKKVLGTVGEVAMPIFIGLSAFGSTNGSIMTAARFIFAAARDGKFPFPRQISKVSERTGAPYAALLLQMRCRLTSLRLCIAGLRLRLVFCLPTHNFSWSLIVLLPSSFERYVGFANNVFWALSAVAVMRLRHLEPDLPRPFLVRPYPFVPIAFVTLATGVVLNSVVRQPIETLIGFCIVSAGIPVYFTFFHSGNKLAELYLNLPTPFVA